MVLTRKCCVNETINVDVITKNGDIRSGILRVKLIPGMKQRLFSLTQAMWVVGPCKVAKQNKESFLYL